MKKLLSIILLFSILSTIVLAGPVKTSSFEIRYLGYPEYISEKSTDYHVNVVNDGYRDLKDVQVGVYMPDLGYYQRSGTFNADDRDVRRETFEINLMDAEPGYYPVRLSLYSDDNNYRKVKWTWVVVE